MYILKPWPLLVLMLCSSITSAVAQPLSVEKEMMQARVEQMNEASAKILKSHNFLSPEDAFAQLQSTINNVVAISSLKPYKKVLSKPDIYKRLKQSTVVFSTASIHGTGYVIDASGIIVTNQHIMNNYADSSHKNQVMLVTNYAGKAYPVIKVLSNSNINDLVIVQIDAGKDTLTALPLGGQMEVGDDIYILGHPAEIPYYFSAGIVNSIFIRDVHPHTAFEDYKMFVSADYGTGSSGSPVVDKCCNLVSTVSAASALFGEKNNPQMVFRMTIPVLALQQLIKIK